MEIVLYTNNSTDNTVTKSISVLATITGTLRDSCSIIDPVVIVSNEVVNNAIAAACNYAMIANFGRYYFVRNITLRGNCYEISMHCDVLSSFQTPLKSLDAVVARNENRYNLYLQDGFFRTYQNPHVSVKPFPSGFTDHHYVLAVAGSGGTTPTPPNVNSEIIDTSDSD